MHDLPEVLMTYPLPTLIVLYDDVSMKCLTENPNNLRSHFPFPLRVYTGYVIYKFIDKRGLTWGF